MSVQGTTAPAANAESRSAALGAARAASDAASGAAGVTIRHLFEVVDLGEVHDLFSAVWQSEPTNPPVTKKLMRALAKAGNYIGGAYDESGLIGACVGFFGPPASATLYSQITGVSPAATGRAVGFALKLHQRAWALENGASAITWTFDPLIRRNAYFNIAKLGARPVEYIPDFYGEMSDGINRGYESDRLLARWELESGLAVAASAGQAVSADARAERDRGATVALDRDEHGGPGPVRSATTGTSLIALPPDIEGLRGTDPGLAQAWRTAVREALGGALAAGGRVTGFDRSGWYVIENTVKGSTR